MRAAIYARVSTHDQQTLGPQIGAMTAYVEGRGWDLVKQVKDVGFGAKERAGREALLKAARRREFDVVVVWRLDRWSRPLLCAGTSFCRPDPPGGVGTLSGRCGSGTGWTGASRGAGLICTSVWV